MALSRLEEIDLMDLFYWLKRLFSLHLSFFLRLLPALTFLRPRLACFFLPNFPLFSLARCRVRSARVRREARYRRRRDGVAGFNSEAELGSGPAGCSIQREAGVAPLTYALLRAGVSVMP